MSLTVEWDWPARRILLEQIPWPTSSDVAIAVHRFAREHAPQLPTGEHRFHASGYRITVRVDHVAGIVLVLYLYRRR